MRRARVLFGSRRGLTIALVLLASLSSAAKPALGQGTSLVINEPDGTALWVEGDGGTVSNDYGVRAVHDDGDGVFGWSMGSQSGDTGLTGRGENGYGVYGFTINGSYGLYTTENLFVGGSCVGCSMSLLARNESTGSLRPGDVTRAVGVDTELGTRSPVLEVQPAAPERPVLGVVLGRVEIDIVGASDDRQAGPHFGAIGGEALPGDFLVVVVEGLARVRAGSEATIRAGDWAYLGSTALTGVAEGPVVGMAVSEADAEGLAWVLVGKGSSALF